MNTPKLNRWLQLAVPVIGGMFLLCQPAHAQYSPAQEYNNVMQDSAAGLLTPGQTQNLMNRENNYAQRAARLLRNDGGVLTPNDASKLAREAANDNAVLNQDINNNSTGGGGLSGLFGNLFGTTPNYNGYPATTPYNYGASGFMSPYTTTPYGTPYASVPYATPYAANPYAAPYAPPYSTPYNGFVNTGYQQQPYGANRAHWEHERWEHEHHGHWQNNGPWQNNGQWNGHHDRDNDGD